jgi:hypothetical protein
MGFLDRYRIIREARKIHLPESTDVAGDEGERAALEVADKLIRKRGRHLPCRCYPSLRVPRPGDRGKYEIDLLVASPFGLVGLEVKNWGGEVEVGRPGHWEQISSRGEHRDYDDPLALVQEKIHAVQAYLAAQGVPLPANTTTATVVLTNFRLTLGPQLSKLPGVIRLVMLEEMLTPWVNPNAPGFWAALARKLALARTTSPVFADFAAVTNVLDRLPTWDLIGLYGGKVLKGDVTGPGITLAAGNHLSRRDAQMLQLHVPRSWLLGWFATPSVSWNDAGGAGHWERLQMGTTLGMKMAGQSIEVQVPIEHVLAVRFGWRDHSYYDAPKPPLESYKPGTVYQGTVAGVQDFGIFVNLDGHRDGLVHVSKLNRRGQVPNHYQRGQQVTVRVVKTEVRKGKETIELDLHGG